MKIMAAIDMELLLSEYPEFEEDGQTDLNQEDAPDPEPVRRSPSPLKRREK